MASTFNGNHMLLAVCLGRLKAYMVDHSLVLDKLKYCGISDFLLDLISYLSNKNK